MSRNDGETYEVFDYLAIENIRMESEVVPEILVAGCLIDTKHHYLKQLKRTLAIS